MKLSAIELKSLIQRNKASREDIFKQSIKYAKENDNNAVNISVA